MNLRVEIFLKSRFHCIPYSFIWRVAFLYNLWSLKCLIPRKYKVEKIQEILNSIPSPSPLLKIQIMGGKFTWGNKAKHCWVMSKNFLFSKGLLATPSNVLSLHLKQTFPPIIWIFTEGDGIKSRLPFKIFSTLTTRKHLTSLQIRSFHARIFTENITQIRTRKLYDVERHNLFLWSLCSKIARHLVKRICVTD